MYVFDDMIDEGLEANEKWTSRVHRQVAINICICNPNVFNMDVLRSNIKIINAIPIVNLSKVTAQDIIDKGGVA